MKQVHSEFKIITTNCCLGNVAPAIMCCAAFATKIRIIRIKVTFGYVKVLLHHRKIIKAVNNFNVSNPFVQNFSVLNFCMIYFALFVLKVFCLFLIVQVVFTMSLVLRPLRNLKFLFACEVLQPCQLVVIGKTWHLSLRNVFYEINTNAVLTISVYVLFRMNSMLNALRVCLPHNINRLSTTPTLSLIHLSCELQSD